MVTDIKSTIFGQNVQPYTANHELLFFIFKPVTFPLTQPYCNHKQMEDLD